MMSCSLDIPLSEDISMSIYYRYYVKDYSNEGYAHSPVDIAPSY